MDDPALDAGSHRHAMRGLRRINQISRSAHHQWRALRRFINQADGGIAAPRGPVRVLDVACGGGEVAIAMQRMAVREGYQVMIDGCDISPRAVGMAQSAAERLGLPCRFCQRDVLSEDWPKDYQAITCSLFLHHLSDQQAAGLLTRMARLAWWVVIDDLVRCRRGYVLAWVGTRLLSRSPVVHADGLRSVRAAFTPSELRQLARRAGLDGAGIRLHFPARMQLTWRRT